MKGEISAVVGANWGDEGKGKIVDYLAAEVDYVVRFQGGSNAGHTINCPWGRFALHMLPSGVFYDNVTNVISTGVAFDICKFVKELDELSDKLGRTPRVLISDRVQLLLPHHIILDQCEEKRLCEKKFGSTLSGIAPFYGELHRKVGVQLADLFDRDSFLQRVSEALQPVNSLLVNFYHERPITVEEDTKEVLRLADRLKPFVADTAEVLHTALSQGKQILLEGQLGTLRDVYWGIHPHTTSSCTLAGFGTVSAGLPPSKLTKIIAVTKAYSSMVGAGTFVTKIEDTRAASELRARGGDKGEFGATTGRPRDVGWFDCVATRYGAQLQGATEVCLTCLDVLGYLTEIPVCIGYEIDGIRTDRFPTRTSLERAKAIYENLPGWNLTKEEMAQIRSFSQLPSAARDYVEYIEKMIGVPISIISVGPGRDDIILRDRSL